MAEELSIIRRPASVPSPTPRDLLAIVFRQRRLMLVSFTAIFFLALLYGVIAPSYEAQMRVLVRRSRIDPVATPTPTESPLFQREVTEEELNSEVELLSDQEILRTVVQTSGLARQDEFWMWKLGGNSEEMRLAREVRRIARRLKVEPVRKTNLINVTYSSSDPAQAAKLLRCLAAAYLERDLRVRRPSGEFNFFERQMMQSRQGLEAAELRLIEFSRDRGVVSAGLERDMALQKLSDAYANDTQTRVALAETAQRLHTLESKLQALPERTITSIRNSDNPQLLQMMKSRLLDLELKRTELLTKFVPSYRLVQEVDQEITETNTSIAAENQAPVREQTTDLDVNHEWVKAETLNTQVELSTLEAHAQATGIQVAGYREIAQQLGDHAIQQEELQRELKVAGEKYLLYVNKREEARIGDALDQGGILNVTIAEEATVPALPARSEWMFGLIGAVLGGGVSTGLAFAADSLNPSFRTPDEVMAYLGAPVLASLPQKNPKEL
jgi:uncharacterized protein involved in exopolysaccharide biosynthesis